MPFKLLAQMADEYLGVGIAETLTARLQPRVINCAYQCGPEVRHSEKETVVAGKNRKGTRRWRGA
jgi:hypothetical protein